MANFCLPPAEVDRFKAKLIDGTINPEKLANMTSEERHAFFAKITGEENAKGVNALFESKLLLKNQQRGMITWAKNVAGIKEPVRRDLIAKIGKLDRVLNPDEEKAFMKDLASTKLGITVTHDEAKTISDLASKAQALEATRSTPEQALQKGWTPTAKDLEYGRARYDLNKYVSDMKNEATRFKFSDLKTKSALEVPAHLAKAVLDTSKSIGASLDDSFALRQGAKTFWTNNKEWRKQFIQSFVNIARAIKNVDNANREFQAALMADPHYDQALKDGLALVKGDDVFPTSLPEKIPVAGRAFGASEVAYSAFAENLRLALYKNQMRLAQDISKDVPKDYGKNMAKMVNSLTGRGSFGKAEPVSGYFNVAFYSLRFLKSNVDTLLLHPAGLGIGGTADRVLGKEGSQVTSAAQRKAATNLVKIIMGTAAVLGVAKGLKRNSVDLDPRSADFGKIKVGSTRFDVTGGMSSIVELASQVVTQSTKSSTTGKITHLNDGSFTSKSDIDLFVNFFTNKASPVGGVAVDYAKGQDHNGIKPTVKGEAGKLVTPLGVSNYTELKSDPHSANKLVAVIADAFGISSNTYGRSQKSWTSQPTSETKAFQKAVSPAQFKKANNDYNQRLTVWQENTVASPVYKALPDDQKQATLTAGKTRILNSVLKDYGFKYHKAKTSSSITHAKKSLLQSAQ